MQDTTLDVALQTGEVYNRNGHPLPCALEEGGCSSTSLDEFGYTWVFPENCLFTVDHKNVAAEMIKNEDAYYIRSH